MVEAISILENLLVMLKESFYNNALCEVSHWCTLPETNQDWLMAPIFNFILKPTSKVLAEAQYCTGVSPTENTPTVEAVSPVEFCEEVELNMGKFFYRDKTIRA